MMKRMYWALMLLCFLTVCQGQSIITSTNKVVVVGAMQNVMKKGQLQGTIDLDTITNKRNLYGLGPVEYLSGELMIVNGKSYKSTVQGDTAMLVEETFKARAPFFVYSNVSEWIESVLPDSVKTLRQVEKYLDETTRNTHRPFSFVIKGMVEQATIHIVNLPPGTKVSSSEEAHQGLKQFNVVRKNCEILGFFSTEHKAIFTHHDTYMHLHLITDDERQMGHLEQVELAREKIRLFLPKQ